MGVEVWPWRVEVVFDQELLGEFRTQFRLLQLDHHARDREGIVVSRWGERLGVEGIASIAAEVLEFGSWHDERVEPLFSEDGADGMNPGPTVYADRGEESETETMFVEEIATLRRKVWASGSELAPSKDRRTMPI